MVNIGKQAYVLGMLSSLSNSMKIKIQLTISVPIKFLSSFTIPISATITQKIDIKIVGNCRCSIKDGIADISLDVNLTAANALIPNAMLKLGKNAIKEFIIDRVIEPLRDNDFLIESEFKIDDEIVNL